MHVGVLTGGGDVPGLNAAIKSIYRAAKDRGWIRHGGDDADVTGILRGWMGAVQMGDAASGSVLPLTDEKVRTVDRFGGTFLHTSRTRPDRMGLKDLPPGLAARRAGLPRVEGRDDLFDVTDEVIGNLRRAGIEWLVAIGGDDTLGYAHTLGARGFPVVGIPKTMDNDVRGTEYAIGYKTALTRADQFINRQRTHLGSNETIGVFRIFGRNAGFTALGTAMAISDLRCAIPEHAFDLEALCRLVQRDYEQNENHYALVLISEGAIWQGGRLDELGPPDAYGHRKKANVGEALADAITRRTGLPTRHQELTYDLRSGSPDAIDKIVANTFGTLSVDLIARGMSGRMICLKDGLYSHTDLPDPALGARTVDVAAHYDTARFRPNFSGLLGRPVFP
ncbi:MAG TPA: 6-phosphofructokinase [Candidatus Polarisedimenticolia bacterium]|jgi:6-phosphofructokinase 1|nr:6-phosphofructokinase [Candidatus Polarisedimenticolia bacterium]